MSDPVLVARSRVARAVQRKDAEDEFLGRQQLAAAKLERAVREAIAAAPPLTTEQKQHIAMLLLTGEVAK
jgi:hypothetical protein